MIDAFRVELLDTVTFTFNEENNLFDIQVVSNNNDVKLLHGFPGLFKLSWCLPCVLSTHTLILICFVCSVCHDLPEECEEVLENAYFTDITDITEEEMNCIVDGMKILMSRFNMETAVPKLYIHELDKDDMYSLVSLKFLFSDNIIINSLENLLSK